MSAGQSPSGRVAGVDLATAMAAGAFVYAVSLVLHQGGHALVGGLMGGHAERVAADVVLGDWNRLDERGHMLMQLAGPLTQSLVALVGWLAFRTQVGRPGLVSLVTWLFFSVNAWIATLELIASPSIGFGDWMAVLQDMKNAGLLRVSATGTGLFVAGLLLKGTLETLAQLIGNGLAPVRVARARRVVAATWTAGCATAMVGALYSPHGAATGLLIAAGSVVAGTSLPLFLMGRIADHPVAGTPLAVPRSTLMLGLGAVSVIAMVLVFGPGLVL